MNMTCETTNLGGVANVRGGACVSQTPVAAGDAMTCKVQFPMPANLPEIRAGSGALNDSNGGPIATAGNNPSATPLVQSAESVSPQEVPLHASLVTLLMVMLSVFGIHALQRYRLAPP